MSEATKKAKISSVEDFVDQSRTSGRERSTRRESAVQATDTTEFSNIDSNPFYKVLFNPDLNPTQKKEEAAKLLTFAESAEESKERLAAFVRFKEYLQFQRKRMAQQIIALTDTEAFSELQQVYQEINDALIEFEDRISPLTDIVDAVYTLRMNGVTFDAFREIAEDKEAEELLKKLREEQEEKLNVLNDDLVWLRQENATLKQDKWLFGLGPTKKEAREHIAKNQALMADKQADLEALTLEIEQTPPKPVRETQLEGFLEEKAKLRELLDISSDEHKERQELLVKSAQDFVNKTEQRVSNVLQHFTGMNSQIDRLADANYSMREIYAILNDSTKDALDANQDARENLTKEEPGEGDIQKMQRERSLREVENFVGSLSQSHVDTTSVFADLTSSSHRIKSMKDGNSQQISKTRALHTSGVAGVADQLSTVLQAVSAAALGESSEMARMSLERMNQTTQDLSQKEVIRVALGSKEVNVELGKALEDLEQYGEVIRAATGITREGLQETKRLLGDLEDTARTVHEDVRESIGVAADVAAGKGGTRSGSKSDDSSAKSAIPDPFGFSGSK